MSATTSRAIRAIAWKEWREQRPVFLMGVILSAMLPALLAAGSAALRGSVEFSSVADAQLIVLVCLVAPAFVLATGSATLAGETGQGTIDFLLTRPVSRTTLWFVKISMGAAVSLGAVACSTAVALFLSARAGGSGVEVLGVIETLSIFEEAVPGIVGLFLLLLYAATVFFSTFLSRSVTAAGAGLTASVSLFTVTLLIWSRLDLDFEPVIALLCVHLAGISLVILAASLALFRRPGASGTRRAPMVAGLAIAASLALSPVVAVGWLTPLSEQAAQLQTVALSPSGDAIAVTASRDLNSPRVLIVRTDGSGGSRLTSRLTMNPAFSPDGQWIAYLSRRSWLGLAQDDLALRAIRPDGSGDHLIAGAIPRDGWWYPFAIVSPDATRVAMDSGSHLVVGRFGEQTAVKVELAGTPASYGTLLGWTHDGRHVLVKASGPDDEGERIFAFDPGAQTWRLLWETARYGGSWSWCDPPPGGYRRIPVMLEQLDSDGWDLVLVDAQDGSGDTIAEGICRGSVHMPDPGTLAWADCRNEADSATSSIHVKDLYSGARRDVATVEGKVVHLALSPSKEQVFVRRRLAAMSDGLTSTLIGPGGSVKDLPEGWIAAGWPQPSRMLAVNYPEDRIGMVDASTGALRPIGW